MTTLEAQFIEHTLGDAGSWWRQSTIGSVAALQVPETIFGDNRDLLLADIRWLWAYWFVQSLGDPKRYLFQPLSRPRVFAKVLEVVRHRFANRVQSDQDEIASSVSDIVLSMVQGLEQSAGGRTRLSLQTKGELLDRANDPPRCWICGGVFPESAIDRFMTGNQKIEINSLQYVDILKPRGIRGKDLAIQVDHIHAFAQGGGSGDNLALACAWCNSGKSWHRWLYDPDSRFFDGREGQFKGVDLPKPFWVVRLLGAERQCFHKECEKSADNDEVTVAPIANNRVFNPANLCVTCEDHDPFRDHRFQPRDEAARAWGIG